MEEEEEARERRVAGGLRGADPGGLEYQVEGAVRKAVSSGLQECCFLEAACETVKRPQRLEAEMGTQKGW